MHPGLRFPMSLIFLFSLYLLIFPKPNLASVLVEINNLRAGRIEFAGFILKENQEVKIEAYGLKAARHFNQRFNTFAWILNSETREVVWKISESEMDRVNRYEAEFRDTKILKPGTYEVYYAALPFYFMEDYDDEDDFDSFLSNVFSSIFSNRRHYYRNFNSEKLFIRIEGTGQSLNKEAVIALQEEIKNQAFLCFTGLRAENSREQMFNVSKPTRLRIYALGEARGDGEFDFGWIVNLETRARVWQLNYRRSERAGGAEKNRLSNEIITLQPGVYRAVFITDDSHHYGDWNSLPPYDPEFWGLTIFLEDAQDMTHLNRLFEVEQSESKAIVELIRVRDDEYRSQGFTLKNPLNIHIYALGEGRDGEMFDYGWIVDMKTRKKVWEMKYRETEPAGGASKNRVFDGIVHLEPGNYMVYYLSDDSHAYHSWNDSKPFDEKKWGITLRVMDASFKAGDIEEYKELQDSSIIAKIIRVGDRVRERRKFTIEKDDNVHIYALGEGDREEMYDYAYIENANNGRVVWEMTYRNTERAGGARKNRLFNDEVYLEAGTYYIIYESDDSHSFADWNDTPPQDPDNWGVTISRVE